VDREEALPRAASTPLAVPWLACAVLAAIPVVWAVLVLGRVHPDEVYQFLEPAYRKVHGYGIVPWEWKVGLRNWAAPQVIAWLLELAGWLGLSDPRACRAVIAIPQWALGAWALAAVYRYAHRRVGQAGARLSLALVALTGTLCIYAGRTLGEALSAAFLLVALEALDRDEAGWREGALGGLGLGLAVVVRYGSALFVVVALGWLFATRRWRVLGACVVAGALVAAGLGALDWVTWGGPFHSLFAYVDFNVFSRQAAQRFGEMSPLVYLPPLLEQLPLWVVPGLLLAVLAERPRVSLAGAGGVLYVAALFCTLHKEDRFLYPGLVVLAMAAAPHVARWALGREGWRRPAAMGGLLVLSMGTAFFGPELRGDEFRAIVQASRQAHGLLIVNEGVWGAGGYFYVGRDIPWWTCDQPGDPAFRVAMGDPRFDRVVTYDGRAMKQLLAGGFRVVEEIGEATVLAR
jgi:hypothetical protein